MVQYIAASSSHAQEPGNETKYIDELWHSNDQLLDYKSQYNDHLMKVANPDPRPPHSFLSPVQCLTKI